MCVPRLKRHHFRPGLVPSSTPTDESLNGLHTEAQLIPPPLTAAFLPTPPSLPHPQDGQKLLAGSSLLQSPANSRVDNLRRLPGAVRPPVRGRGAGVLQRRLRRCGAVHGGSAQQPPGGPAHQGPVPAEVPGPASARPDLLGAALLRRGHPESGVHERVRGAEAGLAVRAQGQRGRRAGLQQEDPLQLPAAGLSEGEGAGGGSR